MAADQRYCLRCGARVAAPRVDPLVVLGLGAVAPPVAAPPTAPGSTPALPSRRVAAVLAAATLVAGTILGAAIGPAPTPSLAAAPGSVIALLPATAPALTAALPPATSDAAVDVPAPAADSTAADDTPDASATAATDAAAGIADATVDDSAPAVADDPGTATGEGDTTAAAAPKAVPHVWVVTLTGLDAATAFGPGSPLADLTARGTLLSGYAPVSTSAAANGLALLGGQVPAADCATDLAACVLPVSEPSLPGQLRAAELTWKAYAEDPAARCGRPPSPRLPVLLFGALAQRPDCADTVVGLDALAPDLADVSATPALSFVVPAAADLATAAPVVHDVVGKITATAAYRDGGAILLLVDAPPDGADPAAPPATGALVLSPRATAGRTVDTATGPVALLRSLDELFGAPLLGLAAQAPAGALDGVLSPTTSLTDQPTQNTTRRSP